MSAFAIYQEKHPKNKGKKVKEGKFGPQVGVFVTNDDSTVVAHMNALQAETGICHSAEKL